MGLWDPRGRFLSRLSGKGSSSWLIPTWVGFVYVGNTYLGRLNSMAVPTQVRVPETNSRLLSSPLFVDVFAISVSIIVGDYDRVQALHERGLGPHLRRIDGGLPIRHDNADSRRWGGGRRQ